MSTWLCCLLPGQVLPSCAWCRMCCAHTLLCPQASSPWPWDTATGTGNVRNTGTSLWRSYFWVACLYSSSPPGRFLYLTADVPALPFAKGLRGFCIPVLSLCHLSWMDLVHVGLCSGVRSRHEFGAGPLGLLPSLSHPPFCLCRILIYWSHLPLNKISIVSKGHFV